MHEEGWLLHQVLSTNFGERFVGKPETCNLTGSQMAENLVDEFSRKRNRRAPPGWGGVSTRIRRDVCMRYMQTLRFTLHYHRDCVFSKWRGGCSLRCQ